MAFVGWALLLLFLAQLHSLIASIAHARGNLAHHSAPSLTMCHPDQANSLLKLKQSFSFDSYSTTTLPSWQSGTDCCLWEGVGCSNSSGHVAALNLSGFELHSPLGIDPVLFNLTSLRLLDLSMNDFGGGTYYDSIPSVGFERLTLLTHLNLSNSGISGSIPASIGNLTNLISLDLSRMVYLVKYDYFVFSDYLYLEYRFHDLIANLANLRELILDGVFISSRAEDCFKALAKSTPHLRVLSLSYCNLQGHIDRSLSRLRNLDIINLSGNYGMTPGPFPEFIMNFLNLSVLRLAGINLEGWFPRGIFQSKNLRVLDLSRNPNLLGHMPNFSNASSLKILRFDMTNFSYAKSKSSSGFNSIMELGLDGNFISMDFLSSFSIFVSLRKLVLTRISSLIKHLELVFSWIEDMGNLTSLVLHECDCFTATTSALGNSKRLTSFVISSSNLTVQTLRAVTNLKNLKSFAILQCDLFGQLPSAIGNMSNLETLDISDCLITGPIPREVGALKKLTSLQLVDSGLSGRIPSSIGNLTQLTSLVLSENQLSGEIPTSIFTLPELQDLDLSWNQLSGPLQEFDVISSHLKLIDLSYNKLMGTIPKSFFLLTSLSFLDIAWNNFMGSVDLASLWRLENLTNLVLSNNKLSVTDGEGSNSSSTYLSGLHKLELANCNITKIPNFLTRVNHIFGLDLSSNKLSGDIPKWMWERWLSSLRSLNLSHNMFTGMELTSYVIPFSSYMDTFDLSSNRLQGQIPMPSLSAGFLDYSNNTFSSVLSNFTLYLSHTRYLSLSKNNISGYLPISICDSNIRSLDLSYNNFRGLVPPCLLENGLVMVLNLRENKFEGVLPSNISSGCSLETVDLHDNKIEGQLPRTLYNCSNLEVLDMGRNQITDTFPSLLGRLLNLRVLILRSNHFHGSIGYLKDEKSGEHFPSLQIIDLASNNFSGTLHPHWFEGLKSMQKYNNIGQIIRHGNLTEGLYQDTVTISYKGFLVTFERVVSTLTVIDLSDNALEGSIPASIGKLVSLHVLNLSHNAFTGDIPPQLGGITALESLDLSTNILSDEIPPEITNLTFLSILNFSNNRLEGRIPQSRQFMTFQSSSFDGNAGLCGSPLSKQCGTPDTPEAHLKGPSSSVDIVLFLFVGVGFGVGFAAAILVKLGWIKRWFRKVNSANMT